MKRILLSWLFLTITALFLPVCDLYGESVSDSQLESLYPVPRYISALPNLNDYDIFANAGWDGNWYVGYNVCWVKKLPPVPDGNYTKAFIGAKLGREKTIRSEGKPIWEKEPVQGDIYIGVSSTSSWLPQQRYFLTAAEDIPLEGDPDNALNDTGESRWFWTEVPLDHLVVDGNNFIALWAQTPSFTSRENSPILCGGLGAKDGEKSTWLNNDINGLPPEDPASVFKTPISSLFEPAIAIKLIPAYSTQEISVTIIDIKRNTRLSTSRIITAKIDGSHIYRAWLELSSKQIKKWKRLSRHIYNPPYMFTLNPDELPAGRIKIRVVAEDEWSNLGYSSPFEMYVK